MMDNMRNIKEMYEAEIANGWDSFDTEDDEYDPDEDYCSGRLHFIATNEGKEIEKKTVYPFSERKGTFYLIRIPETGKLDGYCPECCYAITDIKDPAFYSA